MRLILLAIIALLVVDALYYDGSNTQAAQREVSAAVTSLMATVDRELDRTAESEPDSIGAAEEPPSGS